MSRTFQWTFASDTPELYPPGSDAVPEYWSGSSSRDAGIGLSGSDALNISVGAFSVATFDKINDTTGSIEWAPVNEGAVVMYFMSTSLLATGMLWQITGKAIGEPAYPSGIDTNDGVSLRVRNSGTQLRFAWGGSNGSAVTFVNVTPIGGVLKTNQWYKATAKWNRGGTTTLSLQLDECDSTGVVTAAGTPSTSTSALAATACLTWHHLLIGNDTSTNLSGTGTRIDGFEVWNDFAMSGGEEPPPTTSSITQFGVTFHFQDPVDYGQFANGDYYVIGPVTITQIEPDFSSGSNGWEVNPLVQFDQGFQQANIVKAGPLSTYNASLMPSLPYTASTAQSIVKTIASGVERSSIATAVVLTVLESEPAGGGALYFRPPYIGTSKPLYPVSALRTDLLPSLAPVGTPPSLATVVANFSKCLRMDHNSSHPRYFRPSTAMNDYFPSEWPTVAEAMLRLCLNDPIEDKMPALIQFTQHALDRTYIAMAGYRRGGDGHNPGQLLLAAWGAVMLDVSGAQAYLQASTDWQESEYTYWSTVASMTLWGDTGRTEFQYWDNVMTGGGNKSAADPYRIIDGGSQGTSSSPYQDIVSQCYKSQAILGRLIPELRTMYPDGGTQETDQWSILENYAERWVTQGSHTQPDPAAPYDGNIANYGVTFGPNPSPPPAYIEGAGRFPAVHGSQQDGGQYKSQFVASMWDAYWESDVTPTPDAPSGLSADAASATQITLSWTDNSSVETAFEIERSAVGGGSGFSLIHQAPANATSYSDAGLSPETTYYYRVRATNATGESAYTSEASAQTDAAPSGTAKIRRRTRGVAGSLGVFP